MWLPSSPSTSATHGVAHEHFPLPRTQSSPWGRSAAFVGRLSRIRREHGQTSALLWTSGISIALGAASLAAGMLVEDQGWVQDRPLLAIVFSGLTGALFGTPVVLLAVERISFVQAQKAQRVAAGTLAGTAADRLADAIRRLVAFTDSPALVPAINRLGETARRVEAQRELWRSKFKARAEPSSCPGRVSPDLEPRLWADLAEAAADARTLIDEIDAAGEALSSVIGDDEQRRRLASQASAAWRFIDDKVKPRLLEIDAPWLDQALSGYLQTVFHKSAPRGAQISRLSKALERGRDRLVAVAVRPQRLLGSGSHSFTEADLVGWIDLDIGAALTELEDLRRLEERVTLALHQLRRAAHAGP
ncbi:hypothetical protein [Pseudonocardia oroxyli]|nr:hypothetical protein [Pseudonocardia oroxyli]